MLHQLCLEEMEGRWVAHVPSLWGCFASANTLAQAVAEAPQAIADYWNWLASHRRNLGELAHDPDYNPPNAFWFNAPPAPVRAESIQVEVVETHPARLSKDDNEINAFFESDRAALDGADLMVARHLLAFTRADLMDAFLGLSSADLDHTFDGERWPMRGIVRHVALGENWYLDRFALSIEAAWNLPDLLGQLTLTRQQLLDVLPTFVGLDTVQAVDDELWSPRKIIRRAVWHERDHTQHLWQLRHRLAVQKLG